MRIFRRLKEQHIVLLALACFVLVSIGLISLLFSRENRHNRLSIEYEAARTAFILAEQYGRSGTLEIETNQGILGFGLYQADSNPVVRWGTAPRSIDFQGRPALRITQNRVILVQGLGMAPRMREMMEQMRRGHRMPPPPEIRSFVYIELDRTLFGTSNYQSRWFILLILIAVALIMAALSTLYRRNRRYRQKAESQAQLVQLGEAARTLAHEIRNPLSSIRIQSRLLEKKLSIREKDHLAIINQEVERLNLLSARVGEFLRNPAGSPQSIDLHEYLRQLRDRLEYPLKVFSFSETPVYIQFDPDRLPTVVDNIVRNAAESMGRPDVEVRLSREGAYISMNVLDRGTGIKSEHYDRIFDPFFTTKTSGSGIGLATARQLVQAMGGRIVVSPRKNGGTSVKVLFVCTS